MNKDEALKLALEALEIGLPLIEDFGSTEQFNAQHIAISAIYEALAKPEPEYVAFMDVPHRPWVGLTKEERHEISMANRPCCADVMAAHEEELKRRNT